MLNRCGFLDRRSALVTSLVALFTVVTLGAPPPANAADQPRPSEALRYANALSEAFAYAADQISPAVVSIRAVQHLKANARGNPQLPEGFSLDDPLIRRFFGNRLPQLPQRQEGVGSGVIVSNDGYILTNNHVAGGADEVTVTLRDGRELKATVVGADPPSDLAVIRVKGQELPVAKLGDSDKLRVGEWVVAAGNPFGLSDTITAGIVSAKGRSNMRVAEYEDFIQTDAAINPGNSGGPLVNLNGEVVGINTAIATRTGVNNGVGFTIPINMAKSIMDTLIQHGRVTRGWLGVTIQPLTEDMARSFGYDSTEGTLVADVQKRGPAEEAGLQQGDIVTKLDDTKVKDMTQFRNVVAMKEPGSKVKLEVFRDGGPKIITAKLGTRPQDAEVALRGGGKDEANELGLTVSNITPELIRTLDLDEQAKGVVVTEVDPDGLGAKAGLEPGNVILKVAGSEVDSVSAFRAQLKHADLKKGVRLLVQAGEVRRFAILRQPED